MIDGLKLDVSYGGEDKFFKCPKWVANMTGTVDLDTGEVTYPYVSKVDNVSLHIFGPTSIEFRLSLHTYQNIKEGRGHQNFDRFQMADIAKAVDSVSAIAYLCPSKIKFRGLEFGVNIPVKESASKIIGENLILHGNKPITVLDDSNWNKYYTQIKRSEFDVKIYDKSLQFELPSGLLRFEIKCRKSRNLFGRVGRITFQDLKRPNIIRAFGDDLIREFDKVLIVDNFDPDSLGLSQEIISQLQDYRNPNYWVQQSNTGMAYRFRNRRYQANRSIKRAGLLRCKKYLSKSLRSEISIICQKSPVCNAGFMTTKTVNNEL